MAERNSRRPDLRAGTERVASPTVEQRVRSIDLRLRGLLLAALAIWGWRLIRMDVREGEICGSFIHLPLLVFHEAGHVVFRPFGHWMTVAGGTLGQLLMPCVLGIALWVRNRDRFGAALAMWFLGVSVLDVAPYMYDAFDPRLILLNGMTGEEGGHDWIYLFSSMGLLERSQSIGLAAHAFGAAIVLAGLGWAGVELWRLGGEDAG